MKDRLALPLRFDAEAMRQDLARLDASDWVDHFVTQNYDGTWSVLPLRAPAGADHPIQMIYSDPAAEAFVDTALLERCPYLQQVLATFQCPLHAARLMKLTPGSSIKTHSDHDLAAEYGKVRLHIPIATNPDVEFLLNGERVVMREGECWYLRLSDPHAVANRGATDRVHLVVDATLSPWLQELLRTANDRADEPGNRGTVEPWNPGAMEPWNPGTLEPRNLDWAGWVPYRIRAEAAGPVVDWCDLGEHTFSHPFFEQTIRQRLRKPLNPPAPSGVEGMLVRQTPIASLIERRHAAPGLPPTAFIFHCSRCGSTLLSQMLAALPDTVVISEAAPIDEVLRARVPDAARVEWLQALLSALGQPRRPTDRFLFVKFDAWHVLDLTLVQRAFPDAPCVFLYRDPSEVIASQLRMPGIHMIPGTLDPALIGLDLEGVLRLGREEHAARILAPVYAAALTHASAGRVTLLNYSELPAAAIERALEWCGLSDIGGARETLERVATFDAKTPSLPFDAANSSGRPGPTQRAVEMADRFVTPSYKLLEAIRGGTAP